MEIELTLALSRKLIAIAVFFQSIELLQLKRYFSDQGVWRWSNLEEEFDVFSGSTRKVLAFSLRYKNFLVILILRIIASIFLVFFTNSFIFLFLLFSTFLIALRWRGVFNGGSDYMTIVVLSALTFESFLSDISNKISLACIWYITIQLFTSYFIAGVVKLRRPNWRNGKALNAFLNSTIYNENSLSRIVTKNKSIVITLSWMIILFELTFIAALISSDLCVLFILAALFFHLANFYFFGLNRFIFVWAACYPALLFCSGF